MNIIIRLQAQSALAGSGTAALRPTNNLDGLSKTLRPTNNLVGQITSTQENSNTEVNMSYSSEGAFL